MESIVLLVKKSLQKSKSKVYRQTKVVSIECLKNKEQVLFYVKTGKYLNKINQKYYQK